MSEIERLAERFANGLWDDPGFWTACPGENRDQFCRAIRAVLAAMREPSEEATLAGAKAALDQHVYKKNAWDRGYVQDEFKQDHLNGAKYGWQAMIDHLLAVG